MERENDECCRNSLFSYTSNFVYILCLYDDGGIEI